MRSAFTTTPWPSSIEQCWVRRQCAEGTAKRFRRILIFYITILSFQRRRISSLAVRVRPRVVVYTSRVADLTGNHERVT
jgi:hypothetical protein